MAGFRPGLGLGGKIHVFCIEIVGASAELCIGARGLLTVEGVAGVRTDGESAVVVDVPFEEDIWQADATRYEGIVWTTSTMHDNMNVEALYI